MYTSKMDERHFIEDVHFNPLLLPKQVRGLLLEGKSDHKTSPCVIHGHVTI